MLMSHPLLAWKSNTQIELSNLSVTVFFQSSWRTVYGESKQNEREDTPVTDQTVNRAKLDQAIQVKSTVTNEGPNAMF